jgi:putative IMPACT (imprinted ancient) family translation regulator
VRWFGGTKLGKGGLARAYAGATIAALETLPTRAERPASELEVEVPHAQVGAVKRLLRPDTVTLVAASYGERATLRLRVSDAALDALEDALAELRLELRAPRGERPPNEGDLA